MDAAAGALQALDRVREALPLDDPFNGLRGIIVSVAASAGMAEDTIAFLVCMLSAWPLALVHRVLPGATAKVGHTRRARRSPFCAHPAVFVTAPRAPASWHASTAQLNTQKRPPPRSTCGLRRLVSLLVGSATSGMCCTASSPRS